MTELSLYEQRLRCQHATDEDMLAARRARGRKVAGDCESLMRPSSYGPMFAVGITSEGLVVQLVDEPGSGKLIPHEEIPVDVSMLFTALFEAGRQLAEKGIS